MKLTLAISEGRLNADAIALLQQAGLRLPSDSLSTRRLAVEDESGCYRLMCVKPTDVAVCVEHGVADCGIVGRDVLLESEPDLLQPLALNIGLCRIVVAARNETVWNQFGMLRVATKYPRIAARHYGARGVAVDLIELSGSVELAPVLGLADCIVDLVETGRTLSENGLCIVPINARSAP